MFNHIQKPCFSTLLKLPILDLSPFILDSTLQSKSTLSKEIAHCSEEYGVLILKNPYFPSPTLFPTIKAFFSLPEQQKNLLKSPSKAFIRGYIGLGEESGSEAFEVKEAYSLGYNWAKSPVENPLQSANIYPKIPDTFKNELDVFYKSMCAIAKGLTKAYSLSLGHNEDYLPGFCHKGDTISLLRLFHYFPYEKAPKKAENMMKIGSSEHTDWGFLTIIQEDETPGLEIFYKGEWRGVEAHSNCLIVNCGDYLSLLTKGKFISPLHRVVTKGKERFSIVFFYYPDYEARIPELGGERLVSLYKDQLKGGNMVGKLNGMGFGEYIMEKWRQVTRDGKIY